MIRLMLSAGLALAGSVLLHGGGLMMVPGPMTEALAGGESIAPPILGDSFADLSQGMAQVVVPARSLPATDVAEIAPSVEAPAALPPVTPDAVVPVATKHEAARPRPDPAPAVAVARADPSPRVRPAARPEQPINSTRPETPHPAAKAKDEHALTAKGSQTPARKGTTAGQSGGTSASAKGQNKAQGDGGRAAAASYGNAVMRKISKTRKRATRLRGTAVISFRITASGQLASVRVSRSSGSVELDALGTDHIRRAAPFPKPPTGASARFSVEFQGR